MMMLAYEGQEYYYIGTSIPTAICTLTGHFKDMFITRTLISIRIGNISTPIKDLQSLYTFAHSSLIYSLNLISLTTLLYKGESKLKAFSFSISDLLILNLVHK